jgi:hypothetical protein
MPKSSREANRAMAAGSNKGRAGSSGPGRGASRSRSGLYTWGAIGVVVIVVVVLVIVKVGSGSGGSGPTSAHGFVATSPAVVSDLTSIPEAEFNTIGITSTASPVSGPTALKGQPALSESTSNGTLPEVYYLGAEYCPFCAAQRWSTIIALSRFGTWSGLGNMSSASSDEFPNTPTFTFSKASYTSKYVAFSSTEEYTNYLDSATNYWTLLQKPTTSEAALWKKYDSSKFIPSLSSADDGSIPFVDYGGKYVSAGSGYTPQILASQSRADVAGGLSDASSPITAAILSEANYQTAAICAITGGKPGNVCNSSGVKAAAKALASS